MFLESPRFPNELAYGARGGPQYSTSVVGTLDDTETRNQNWARPLARYDVGLVNRDRATTESLFAFFRTVAQGKTNGFRFRDPLPGEAEGVQEVIGVGDGTTQTFQLVKQYASGDDYHEARVITKPVPGTVQVWLQAVLLDPSTYAVDHTRGLVMLPAPVAPGQVLQASYQFDVPVRFDTDQLRLQRVAPDVYSWESIVVIETRNFL